MLDEGNAQYCPGDRNISFDLTFMLDMNENIGDSMVFMIVAHEWGHAVADQLDENEISVAGELLADCLAAAAMYGAVEDGSLTLEKGDEKEIFHGLTDISDEEPWGEPRDHGAPSQRIEWFIAGKNNGPSGCF